MAAQLTLTNSPLAWKEFRCSQRARTSLPVPPSPLRSTGTLVRQILAARCRTSRMAREFPKRSSSGGSIALSTLANFVATLEDIFNLPETSKKKACHLPSVRREGESQFG